MPIEKDVHAATQVDEDKNLAAIRKAGRATGLISESRIIYRGVIFGAEAIRVCWNRGARTVRKSPTREVVCNLAFGIEEPGVAQIKSNFCNSARHASLKSRSASIESLSTIRCNSCKLLFGDR